MAHHIFVLNPDRIEQFLMPKRQDHTRAIRFGDTFIGLTFAPSDAHMFDSAGRFDSSGRMMRRLAAPALAA